MSILESQLTVSQTIEHDAGTPSNLDKKHRSTHSLMSPTTLGGKHTKTDPNISCMPTKDPAHCSMAQLDSRMDK